MAWQALVGVVEWWADEGLRDVGRCRHHQTRGKTPAGTDAPRGTIFLFRAGFAARRDPWRLAQVSLRAPDDAVVPAAAAWADAATVALTGHPAQPAALGPDASVGDLNLRRMLDPAALETLMPKPWPARFHIAGDLLERDMSLAPELVSLAADRYEVTYDAQLDVVTGWQAIIDGEVAQQSTLTHLAEVGA